MPHDDGMNGCRGGCYGLLFMTPVLMLIGACVWRFFL
jgi:hypothetical protein